MKRCVGMLVAVCVLVSSGQCFGQEEPPPKAQEHLKAFEPYIGTWFFKTDVSRDLPEIGLKKGDPLAVYWRWEWCVNKNAVLLTSWGEDAQGKRLYDGGIAVVGWDPQAKQIVDSGRDPYGARYDVTYEKTASGWLLKMSGVSVTGKKSSKDVLISLTGETLTRQEVNRIDENGVKLEDKPAREWARLIAK